MSETLISGCQVVDFITEQTGRLGDDIAEIIKHRISIPKETPCPEGCSRIPHNSQVQWESPLLCFGGYHTIEHVKTTLSTVIEDVLSVATVSIWKHFIGRIPYDYIGLGGRWIFDAQGPFKDKGKFVGIFVIPKTTAP